MVVQSVTTFSSMGSTVMAKRVLDPYHIIYNVFVLCKFFGDLIHLCDVNILRLSRFRVEITHMEVGVKQGAVMSPLLFRTDAFSNHESIDTGKIGTREIESGENNRTRIIVLFSHFYNHFNV